MRAILPFLAVCTVLLSGCSAGTDMERAQKEVTRFHEMLDAGRYAEIYAASGPQIHRDMDQPHFVAFLANVHDRLGPISQTNSTGWNVNYGTSGNNATLTYVTLFARGKAEETFVYDLSDGKATLTNYYIKSDQLLGSGP